MVTRGPSGVEYGHARRARNPEEDGRCPRRPDCVDPSKPAADQDGWMLPGGETSSTWPQGGESA